MPSMKLRIWKVSSKELLCCDDLRNTLANVTSASEYTMKNEHTLFVVVHPLVSSTGLNFEHPKGI